MILKCSNISRLGLILCTAVLWSCHDGADKQKQAGAAVGTASRSDSVYVPEVTLYPDGEKFSNEGKEKKLVKLSDGSEVLLGDKSLLRVSKDFNGRDRGLVLDGEAYFNVKGKSQLPFVIHTRNLRIEVLGTLLRVDAYSSNAGEEVELVSGKLRVSKSYHSPSDNEPELLDSGDMVMINRDIDLIEKERMDSTEKLKWNGELKKSFRN